MQPILRGEQQNTHYTVETHYDAQQQHQLRCPRHAPGQECPNQGEQPGKVQPHVGQQQIEQQASIPISVGCFHTSTNCADRSQRIRNSIEQHQYSSSVEQN